MRTPLPDHSLSDHGQTGAASRRSGSSPGVALSTAVIFAVGCALCVAKSVLRGLFLLAARFVRSTILLPFGSYRRENCLTLYACIKGGKGVRFFHNAETV